MHTYLKIAAAALALPTLASAQLLIAPENSFLTQPSSSALTWRTTAFRFQMIYDTTHFTNQGVVGPISIDRMRFRAANGNTAAGGVYAGDGATFGVNISIGTSLTDYTAPSTTFANNRGVMQTVMQNGTVTVAPGAGTTPNDYVIDIVIPGGFVYDPTLGSDLLIEVDAPLPSPTTIPTMATGSSSTTHKSVRISNTTQAATTGTTSGFASVVLFDISGGPGGVPAIVAGTTSSYGNGCYQPISRAFCEQFPVADPALDLGAGITLTPNAAGAPTAYVVQSGAGAFVTPTGTPVLSNAATPAALGDDTMSQALNLTSFTFPFSGGSTNVVHANTNGYIALGATTQTGGDFSPSLTDLVGQTTGTHSALPRLFPCWYDLHASRNVSVNPAAGLYFEEDTVNQTATITWLDFGELATSAAGAKSFNVQAVLYADGTVEYRYGAMSPFGSTSQSKIVGYNPGGGAQVPASQDLTLTMPFVSSPVDVANVPLSLAASPAPVLGGTTNLTTSNVPAPGLGLTAISFAQIPAPGIDLAIIGMPGCALLVDPINAVLSTLVGTPSGVVALGIPSSPTVVGAQLFCQSLALDPTFPNSFGAISSNAVAMTVGTVN